ncbi:DUF2851 family protein [Formosa sediminum]|uniref:DUF2851 family protein n=1 Tax=Formosa sediminum TaxID=2594004 RepID=A0A516GLY7_9FLAO|nr:DUF2851 family protein [Formosa sediminum]QDO92533.1 DUF2851 family protein [Formosa sediminum]
MQEDFLHYLWKYKKFNTSKLQTVLGEAIQLLQVGKHNFNSGPDFFNAQLKIEDQLWAGNVEIHIKSSDWYVHHHEIDPAYDNVILHVVWEHDVDIFRKDNSAIPTLVLKDVVSKSALEGYYQLFYKAQKWINCESDFVSVDDFILQNWLERLFFERLERKSSQIETLLSASMNDWEAVLFKLLAKNFGLKVNGESFFSLANSINFGIIRKTQSKAQALEALFFGQSGLLETEIEDEYYKSLQQDYQFLKQKFNLSQTSVMPLQFFRLRPPNFPTIRLSQLAQVYAKNQNLFSKIIEAKTKQELYNLFSVSTSPYWETHYTFQKSSNSINKSTSNKFIDLLIINTIIPVKFSYSKILGQLNTETIIGLINEVAAESNSIIKKYNTLKPITSSALQTQGLLQLKNEYCDKKKCLQCAIGNTILNRF